MADQVSATIVKIGTKAALPSALTISFPTENITIEAITGSPIANSVITYNKEKFYATETQSDLVTAANRGGGGGVTIYTGDGSYGSGINRVINQNGGSTNFTNGALLNESNSVVTIANNNQLNAVEFILEQGNKPFLDVRSDPGEEYISLTPWSTEVNKNSKIEVYANSDYGYYFNLLSDNNLNVVRIYGSSDENELEYTAATHNFIGAIQTGGTPGVSQGPLTVITSITVVNGLITDLQGS